MFGLKIFVRVQTFWRGPLVPPGQLLPPWWLRFFSSSSYDTLTFKLLWQKVVITELFDLSSVLDLISRWQAMDCSAYKDFVGQLCVRQVGIFSYLWSSLLFVSDFSFPFAWSNFLGRTTWSCLGRCAENQNGNLRWHLPWRGGGVSRGSRLPLSYFEKWFF